MVHGAWHIYCMVRIVRYELRMYLSYHTIRDEKKYSAARPIRARRRASPIAGRRRGGIYGMWYHTYQGNENSPYVRSM